MNPPPYRLFNDRGQLRLQDLLRFGGDFTRDALNFYTAPFLDTPAGTVLLPPSAGSSASSGLVTIRVTSASADASGYYTGVITTYNPATNIWTDGATVSVKNINGDQLANTFRVNAFLNGTDPTGGAPAYLTEAGGFTGTLPRVIDVTCSGNALVPVFATETYVNGVLIMSA